MPPLEPRDQFALSSIAGWLMLGNDSEAFREFQQLSAALRRRPEALLLLWEIHSHARRWPEAVDAADRLISKSPEEPEGYIKRAYALHELKRTQEAWDTLHPVSTRFTDNWLIPYNLACYASQLGHTGKAVTLFKTALRLADKSELRDMALNDPDLEPIRSQVEKLTG